MQRPETLKSLSLALRSDAISEARNAWADQIDNSQLSLLNISCEVHQGTTSNHWSSRDAPRMRCSKRYDQSIDTPACLLLNLPWSHDSVLVPPSQLFCYTTNATLCVLSYISSDVA